MPKIMTIFLNDKLTIQYFLKTITLIILFLPFCTLGQFSIQGRIVDEQSSEAITKVWVSLYQYGNLEMSVETDLDGSYHFSNLWKGQFEIEVTTFRGHTTRHHFTLLNTSTDLPKIRVDTNVIAHDSTSLSDPNSAVMSGAIVDAETGSPILFGTVALIRDNQITKGVETDLSGRFTIKDIRPGIYDIQISYVGYKPSTYKSIMLSPKQLKSFKFTISEGIVSDDIEIYRCGWPRIIRLDHMESGSIITSESIKRMPISG